MLWTFRALDTFFFRDGTPFNAEDGSQMGVLGTFPPSIHTLQGAIRTVLARGRGWREGTGYDAWPQQLGDADSLGRVKLQGPYLRQDVDWLFPAPALLLRTGHKAAPYLRLAPGPARIRTDLGPVRLPRTAGNAVGAKDMSGHWLTAAGLAAVLAGGLPSAAQVRAAEALWQDEPRVGIQRQPVTRTVGEGQLYSSVHVRPARGVELAVVVSGLPVDWHPASPAVVRLGGEGRMAEVGVTAEVAPLPEPPPLLPTGGRLQFTVTLVTPGRYGDQTAHVLRHGPPGVPGTAVSACTGKLTQVGGWDLRQGAARPLAPVVPAGATWFYESGPDRAEAVLALHGRCLGEPKLTDFGYGQIVIGRWEESA